MFRGDSSQIRAHKEYQSVLQGGGGCSLKYKTEIPLAVKWQRCHCIFTLQQNWVLEVWLIVNSVEHKMLILFLFGWRYYWWLLQTSIWSFFLLMGNFSPSQKPDPSTCLCMGMPTLSYFTLLSSGLYFFRKVCSSKTLACLKQNCCLN